MTKEQLYDKLEELFDEVPEYILGVGNTYVKIRVSDTFGDGSKDLKVKIDDVVNYYAHEARSMSGCRTIAGHIGDWRPIDGIAKICLEYFKLVNVEKLRNLSRRKGMEPKF